MGSSLSEKKEMNPAGVALKMVEGSVLQGKINIGKRDRVSDIFTKSEEPFVVLFDASYSGGSGKTLVINKNHIVWIEPED